MICMYMFMCVCVCVMHVHAVCVNDYKEDRQWREESRVRGKVGERKKSSAIIIILVCVFIKPSYLP